MRMQSTSCCLASRSDWTSSRCLNAVSDERKLTTAVVDDENDRAWPIDVVAEKEVPDLLWLAVFGDYKVIRSQAPNRSALLVGHEQIASNECGFEGNDIAVRACSVGWRVSLSSFFSGRVPLEPAQTRSEVF